ncbi:PREDICTED: probable WRKY transcription factor protein 1 isoform X2 [Lupinus angustifolius]|uniref:probable WRKY transcription factor protein 1 isoform X2 n=1 Tax=Lupinus angustifolius TaxID=3871 RepID=UPI00092E73EB|nr:PREDICTED: probable WRKY transcription factor protein 1 isoform X2 [Lupinus angustifolius]
MEKNNKTPLSRFSICRKFREALTTNFHGIKQYFYQREPRSVIITTPHSNFETSLVTTHLTKNTHEDDNPERGGAIPIMFDYTNTPRTTMSHIGIIISEREDNGVQHSEQQVKRKSIDINDTFTEYIQRAKGHNNSNNVGKGHNNATTTINNMEKNHNNQNDQFSDFIQHAKNKLRTTSNIGNTTTTTSFKRG